MKKIVLFFLIFISCSKNDSEVQIEFLNTKFEYFSKQKDSSLISPNEFKFRILNNSDIKKTIILKKIAFKYGDTIEVLHLRFDTIELSEKGKKICVLKTFKPLDKKTTFNDRSFHSIFLTAESYFSVINENKPKVVLDTILKSKINIFYN